MQRRALWQRASVAVTTLTMACFGFTGLASADSITDTGPNSTNTITTTENIVCTTTNNNNVNVENSNQQTAVSGSATVEGNTSAGTYWQGWSTLDPATAQASGESYSAWWMNVTNWLADHNDATQWVSTGQNTTWAPSGSNWQSTWTNWDPATWQANGQTYLNWYDQLEAWLGSNSANWMMTWPVADTGTGGSGSAVSGNASNTNSTNFWVDINNGVTPASQQSQGSGSCGAVSTGSGGGGGAITQTGPGSTNTIHSSTAGVVTAANTNNVGYGNSNGQSAYSGPVGSQHNTSSGAGSSGNASNGNSNGGGVGVTNTGTGGGQGGGGPAGSGADISNTGPGSSNSIASSSSSYSNVTNNNDVSVVNSSSQSAYSGSSTSSYNTSTGSGASGAATNGNATGGDVDLDN